MRNSGKRFLALLAALALFVTLLLPLSGLAFGDFDSGSDWGGSDSDSSWSSSDYDYSDSSSSRRHRSSSKGGDGFFSALIGIFYLVAIVAGISSHLEKRSNAKQEEKRKLSRAQSVEKLKAEDPGFSKSDFQKYVQDLFTRMQECWEKGDITPLQDSFAHDLWTRYDIQLQQKNKIGEVTHVRDISFVNLLLYDYRTLYGNEYLDVEIIVDYNVWRTNKEGRNIMGSPSTRHRMTYVWTLTRPAGTKTGQPNRDMNHCPNCGAELDLNAFAECPYCHSMIEKPARKWVLSRIQGVSQKTLHT